MRRKIIMHVGETNSGKTHNALMSLRNAASGVYCGPLRLLAHEVYHRMNMEWNVPCSLITGEERRAPITDNKVIVSSPFPPSRTSHISCTVEMTNLDEPVDVAVLDEIQMLSDPERGEAWTNVLLGLQAREIHCCGEESAVNLIRHIAQSTGDLFEINSYQRLNPLVVQRHVVAADFSDLRPGDCIITFSRKDIFRLKSKIELTGKKCSVIYGGLPPETRVEQALLFNNRKETKHDILIATDAIGMGLNLSIKRIIFHTIEKFDGNNMSLVPPRFVKQIAGRAGRYSINDVTPGFVTSFDKTMLDYIRVCVNSSSESLKQACLGPSLDIMKAFAERSPNLRFYQILEDIENSAILDKRYFLTDMDMKKIIAHAVDHIHLSFAERFEFVNAPVKANQQEELDAFLELIHGFNLFKYKSKSSFGRNSSLPRDYYQDVADNGLQLRQMTLFRGYFDHRASDYNMQANFKKKLKPCSNPTELLLYETMHRVCCVYLWLRQRHPDAFISSTDVVDLKQFLEKIINKSLIHIGNNSSRRTLLKRLFDK